MKVVLYLSVLVLLGYVTWLYPFLFELPLIGALAGAYLIFFRANER